MHGRLSQLRIMSLLYYRVCTVAKSSMNSNLLVGNAEGIFPGNPTGPTTAIADYVKLVIVEDLIDVT